MAKPPSQPPSSNSLSRRPEDWSAAERLRVIAQASLLSEAELGAFLRREGLHEETLQQWRASALEGLSPERVSRSREKATAKQVRELERQLRRKDKALAETAALLVLQKKVQAIWGDEDDSTDPKSDE
jgi:transposase-like protein